MFQPPKASHASGVWERLIRSTRTALKAMLGESLVEEDVLATVLTEVEATLNSRPLSAISDDPNDLQPLTPNHLLLQRTFVKEDMLFRKKWRQTQILADHFWRRWLKEYVPALQERQKWHRPRPKAQRFCNLLSLKFPQLHNSLSVTSGRYTARKASLRETFSLFK